MNWQPSTMPDATVGPYIDKPLDVEIDLLPEGAFYPISLVDDLAYAVYLIISEIPDPNIRTDSRLLQYPLAQGRSDAKDIA